MCFCLTPHPFALSVGYITFAHPQEKLQLTPQQEQTLEAHQALFEQRAAALESSKTAVLSIIADAASKQDDQTAALELLQVRLLTLRCVEPLQRHWGCGMHCANTQAQPQHLTLHLLLSSWLPFSACCAGWRGTTG
jgi:hypothetical protein